MQIRQSTHDYFVKTMAHQNSVHGGTVYNVVLVDCQTGQHVETWISPQYRNYANWRQVVQMQKRNMGVFITNLKFVKKDGVIDTTMIDADSDVEILNTTPDYDEAFDAVNEAWKLDPKRLIMQKLFK